MTLPFAASLSSFAGAGRRLLRAAPVASLALIAISGSRVVAAQGIDPATGAAVPADLPKIVPFSNFYVTAGQAKFDVGPMNARFTNANGFYAYSGDGYTTGIGASIPIGGLLGGIEFHNLDMGYESTPAGRTNLLSAAMVQMKAGIPLLTTWDMTIHADLQLGIGTVTARFRDRAGGAALAPSTNPTWDDILLKPGAESQLNGRFYYVAPGIGLDYIFLKDAKAQRGFTLGLQIASSIAPHRTSWTYGGNTVFGSPDAAPVGTQLRINVGYGGFNVRP